MSDTMEMIDGIKVGGCVRYIGTDDAQVRWGGNDDPRKVLIVGEIYTVGRLEVHTQHTKIYLVGIEGRFNSVSFEGVCCG